MSRILRRLRMSLRQTCNSVVAGLCQDTLPCNCSVATLSVRGNAVEFTRLANQSADYVASRETLRRAEIDLMRQRERVAEMRRQLPAGAVLDDYAFPEGPTALDAGDGPV